MANFTLQEIRGSAVAVLAFAAVLGAPGYVLAQVTDLFGFRGRSLAERTAWAIACSFAVMPIAAYFVGRYAGLGVLCWAAVFLSICAAALLVKDARAVNTPGARSQRKMLLTAGLACTWAAFVILSLVDVQVGSKLYFSVVVFDQSYRVAFTDAVVRTGVPPANPLFFAGHLSPMRYYYFWYVVCAMVVRIAHISARQAFIASSVWAGFGLVATIGLYTRHFFATVRHGRRQVWLTVALLTVTGADLLAALGSLFAQKALNGEMEWWSNDQISSWMDSLLWVPHHIAALLCCLLSFLLLWRTREPLSRAQRRLAAGLASVSFASAFGLSIYVAFGFALLMLAWVLKLLVKPHGGSRRDLLLCGRVLLAGVVSIGLLSPFLRQLAATSRLQPGTRADHLFALSVRRIIDPQLVTRLPAFAVWNKLHPERLDLAMRLLLLLPGLALELGFYGAVLVFFLRAWRRRGKALDEAHGTALYLAVCGLVMIVSLRSSVISNNDFGYRAALLPQFFLLLLGGSLLMSWWTPARQVWLRAAPGTRRIVYGLLMLGLAGTIYQAIMLRLFLPIEEAHSYSGFAYLPAAAFQAREALTELNRVAPRSAVLEFNPVDAEPDVRDDVVTPFTFFDRNLLMDSNRQILNAEPGCAAEFGGNAEACRPIQQATERLYGLPVPRAASAEEYCSRFGVKYLIVSRMDPAWIDGSGWAATLPLIAAEPDLRIVQCGK